MSLQKEKVLFALGTLLVLVGLFDVGDALFGSGRLGAGKLFFDREEVDGLLADAGEAVGPFVELCRDESVAERFDSDSVKRYRRWCERVNAFSESADADTAVGLLRGGNRFFDAIRDKLFADGGEAAQRSLALMETQGRVKPLLEQVGSIRAGASFSEFLIGLFFLIVGMVLLVRRRRLTAAVSS